jgi:hypothetical protein
MVAIGRAAPQWLRTGAVVAMMGLTTAAWLSSNRQIRADDMPTFAIELKDGVITPLRLEVPARRAFKLELRNTGATPAEFESLELHREKVLAPQSTSFIVFRNLDPGEYKFFDDFHPDAPQAILVAK